MCLGPGPGSGTETPGLDAGFPLGAAEVLGKDAHEAAPRGPQSPPPHSGVVLSLVHTEASSREGCLILKNPKSITAMVILNITRAVAVWQQRSRGSRPAIDDCGIKARTVSKREDSKLLIPFSLLFFLHSDFHPKRLSVYNLALKCREHEFSDATVSWNT